MKVDIDIQCKKNENSTEFSSLLIFESAPIQVTTQMQITDKFKLAFEVAPFSVQFDHVKDSKVGHVGTKFIDFISKEFSAVIYKSLNLAGKVGIPLQPIFDLPGLKFIDARDTRISTKDGYI